MAAGLRHRIQQRYWDAHAPGWNRMRGSDDALRQIDRVVEAVAAYVEPGAAIVDLGCGTGQHATAFARAGFAVTAVDYSTPMLEIARANAMRGSVELEFRTVDLAAGLPFGDASFDAALLVSVLQVVGDPARLLGEIRRVLKPAGIVWIESVRELGALSRGHDLRGRDRVVNELKKLAVKVNRNAVRKFAPSDIDALLRAGGFDPVAALTFDATFAVVGRRTE